MSAKPAHKRSRREGGYALIIMLAILIGGSLYALINRLSNTSMQSERITDTARSLQLAKEALLGYAATYRENHLVTGTLAKVHGYGYLPCPDSSADDGNPNFIGAEAESCDSSGLIVIGLLPTKTLGLPDLRDSDGNCLWYAVSSTHMSNPDSIPTNSPTKLGLLNWDTKGQFKIVDAQGNVLEDPAETDPVKGRGGAVAIIFAPGIPLALTGNDQGSGRGGIAKTCSTDSSKAIAYLESTATPFTQGVKKDGADNVISNDQLAWINARELFERIQKRSDFASYLNTGISAIASYLNTYPPTAIKYTRNLPDGSKLALPAPSDLPDSAKNFYTQWRDHFAYLTCAPNCTTSTRYTVNGNSCDGVLVWSGKGATIPRTLSDYFEDAATLVAGSTKTISIAASQYVSALPAQDLVFCLAPPNGFSNFQTTQTSGKSVATLGSTISPTGTISTQLTLGSLVAGSNIYGCSWANQTLDLSTGWRVYFRFNIQKRGAGFTFTLADATTNTAMPNMCGASGNSLGYSGNNGVTNPINSPKLAIEFDTSKDIAASDNRNDSSDNHAAFVYWAGASRTDDRDNQHGSCATDVTPNLPCNSAAAPGINSTLALSISRSERIRPAGDVYVRLDLIPVTPSTSPPTYTMTAYISDYLTDALNVYSTCELDNLDIDVANVATCTTSPTISDTLQTSMVNAYLGFTVGQSSAGIVQQIIIDNFKAKGR